MTVAVLVNIVVRNGLAPQSATLKVNVSNIDAGINDVDIDALASGLSKLISRECAKGELGTVGDTGKTLYCR